MAHKVQSLPSRGRKDSYPFDEWFDGDIWELVSGEDFDISVEGMRSSLHNAGKRKDIKITTRVRDDLIYVQAILEEDGEV